MFGDKTYNKPSLTDRRRLAILLPRPVGLGGAVQTQVVDALRVLHAGHHLAVQARRVAGGQVEVQVEAAGTGDGHVAREERGARVGRVRQDHLQVTLQTERIFNILF